MERGETSLFGLLVQLRTVFVLYILGIVMGGQEAHVVNLSPATLGEAQES